MFSDNKKVKENNDFSKNQNRISEGTKIVGDIVSEGGFRIEGTVEGTIKTTGRVVVGKSGNIQGTLECSNADFEGKFSGKLIITETLSLKPTAHIEGEVSTGKLAVDPGATFNATCVMNGGVKSLNKNGQKQGKSA